jgi:predicted amidophosphoribosyltransferase
MIKYSEPIIKCKKCGDSFKRKGQNHKYCDSCYTERRKKQGQEYRKRRALSSKPSKYSIQSDFKINCDLCGELFKPKNRLNKYCFVCSKDVQKKQSAENHKKNRDKNPERERIRSLKNYRKRKDLCSKYWKEQNEKLTDPYIRKLLKKRTRLKSKDIPTSLIDAKRVQLMIERYIKGGSNEKL